jgi:pentatricopeptide repeat protein
MDEVLRHIPVWPTGVYNVLLNIYGKRAQMDRVEELVEKMRRDGVAFNDVTYGTLVHVYGRAKHADKVAEVMELMKQQEGHIRASFYSVLAATYSRLGDTEGIDEAWEDLMASRLFPDTETYNSFLALYSRHHNVRKMQMVLDSMLRHVPPNPVTSTTVVDMLGKSGRISDMEDLVHDMRRAPETAPTTVTYHQMLNAYAKAGEVAKMERTREEMLVAGFTENAVTFNILADGYGRSRRFEQLGELVARRKAQGVPMEELGYCVLISSYGRARLANEVLRLAGELKAIEDPVDRAAALSRKVLWCLIDALCRCHEVDTMHEWIQALGETSVAERNTLISYYCRCGLMDHAEEIARRIETEDDEDLAFSAFNALAKGHARLGRFDKTVEALHKMRDRNMVPDAATALTLSQLFVRAGLHEQAQQIVLWRRHYARSGQVAADDQEDVIV